MWHSIFFIFAIILSNNTVAKQLFFVAEDLPPFSYATSGNPDSPFGALHDIFKLACQSAKISCKVQVFPWRRTYHMALSGEADGVVFMLPTAERGENFLFSSPIVTSGYSFFADKDNIFSYKNGRDLDKKLIVVYGPSGISNVVADLADKNNATVLIEVSNDIILKKFKAGRYPDGTILAMNSDVGNRLIDEIKIPELKNAGTFQSVKYSIAFSKKSKNLSVKDSLFKIVDEMNKNGETSKILSKYGLKQY